MREKKRRMEWQAVEDTQIWRAEEDGEAQQTSRPGCATGPEEDIYV